MRIFGYNLLTDEEVANIRFKNALDVLKINELYQLKKEYVLEPKCEFCDENRELDFKLPDGTNTKVMCSCNKYHYEFTYEKFDSNKFKFVLRSLDGKIYLADNYGMNYCYYNELDNMNNPHESGLYTSEEKAKKAAKLLTKKYKLGK